MKKMLIIISVIFLGCAAKQKKPEVVWPAAETKQKSTSEKDFSEKTPEQNTGQNKSSTSYGAAGTIQKATKEMEDAILLAELAKKGDVSLNCDNLQESFSQLQNFFGKQYFQYTDYTFWFLTNEQEKISIRDEDGKLHKMIYGLFPPGYKRLVVIQPETQTRTEFYVDGKTGEFMVHVYANDTLKDNRNFILRGH